MDTPGRIAELERKFGENPRRYFAALANEYRRNGELERAIELCERHLAEQRNHLSGHVVLAQALVDAGRPEDAWGSLHTALDLDPENFIALRLLGDLSAAAGDAEQARAYYFKALEIEPRNDQILEALKGLTPRHPVPAEGERPHGFEPTSFGTTAPAEGPEMPAEPGGGDEPATTAAAGAPDEPVAAHAEAEPLVAAEPGQADTWEFLKAMGDETPDEVESVEEPSFAGEPSLADEASPAGEASLAEEAVGAAEPVAEEPWDEADAMAAATWEPSGDEAAAEVTTTYGQEVEPQPAGESETAEAAAADEEFTWGETEEQPAAEGAAGEAASAGVWPEWKPEGESQEEVVAEPQAMAASADAESRPTLVSETMVELYLSQGHTAFAIEALRDLVAQRPGDERLRQRLAELERTAPAPRRETVRDMFARLGRPRARGGEAASALADAFSGAHDGSTIGRFFGDAPPGDDGEVDPALAAVLDPSAPGDEPADFERWLNGLRTS